MNADTTLGYNNGSRASYIIQVELDDAIEADQNFRTING